MLAIPRCRRPAASRLVAASGAGALALSAVLTGGCDKLPLLAPSGTVITLFATSNYMAANGVMEIVATLIEAGGAAASGSATGTPVHNGTLVSFTTTVGTIEPREARTHNGEVSVRLIGNGQSGTATVSAYSGGARSEPLEVKVGAAAADRIVLTASPQTVPSSGGTVDLTALVQDVSGNGLGGVPVTFQATAGTLANQSLATGSDGRARTTLTTSRETEVTANAADKEAKITVRLSPRPAVTITTSTATTGIATGVPVTFSVAVTIATGGAPIRDVRIDFGDGTSQSLGPGTNSSVSHVFGAAGVYTVAATVTDNAGEQSSASTQLVVPPLAVTIGGNQLSGRSVTFTAAVTPSGVAISHYVWNFGDGTGDRTTPGASTSHAFPRPGSFLITVTVVPVGGTPVTAQTEFTVT